MANGRHRRAKRKARARLRLQKHLAERPAKDQLKTLSDILNDNYATQEFPRAELPVTT